MKNKINITQIICFVLGIGFLAWIVYLITPVFSIAQYAHSTTDDYWMSYSVHKVWESTHSIISTIKEAFNTAVLAWKYHSGCFISMLITSLSPVGFNENYYKYAAYLTLIMLVVATVVAAYFFLRRRLKLSYGMTIITACMTLYLLINYIPSPGEGIYWWPGASNYTIFFSVFLIGQSFIITYLFEKKVVWFILSCLFSAVLGLGNLLTALSATCVLFFETLYSIKKDRIKKNGMIIIFILGLTGLLFNVLAPGNFIRGSANIDKINVFETVWMSLRDATVFFGAYHNNGSMIYYVFIAIAALYGFMISDCKYNFRYPVVFVIIGYLIYCSSLAPVEYTGVDYYARILNLIYFNSVIVSIVCIIYLMGYLSTIIKKKSDVVNKYKNAITSVFVVLCIGIIFFSLKNNIGTASFSASYFLDNGDAERFDKRIDSRFYGLYDENARVVQIECEKFVPSIFFFNDEDTMGQNAFYIFDGTKLAADYFFLQDENAVFEDLKSENLIKEYFEKDEIIFIR